MADSGLDPQHGGLHSSGDGHGQRNLRRDGRNRGVDRLEDEFAVLGEGHAGVQFALAHLSRW